MPEAHVHAQVNICIIQVLLSERGEGGEAWEGVGASSDSLGRRHASFFSNFTHASRGQFSVFRGQKVGYWGGGGGVVGALAVQTTKFNKDDGQEAHTRNIVS